MDKDSFISIFPYAVVLVIAPVALLLDFPVVAIAACTLGLIIVAGFFGGLIQLPLMIALLGEIAVGVALLLPEFAVGRGTLMLVFGIVVVVVWLVIVVDGVFTRRAKRRSDLIAESLDDMPMDELVPSLTHIGYTEYADLEERIAERIESAEAEAVPLIIERYGASRHVAEKDRLIKALGGLSGDETINFLKHLLMNEKDLSLLATVVRVSGRTGRADVVAGLARLANLEEGGRYRWVDAFAALGRNGTPEALDSIHRRLAEIENPDDRDWVVNQIIRGCEEGGSEASIAWLAEVAIQAGDPATRARAATALGSIGTPESLGALNDVLAGHWEKDLWKEVLEKIVWYATPTIPCVMELARAQIATLQGDGGQGTRQEALNTLTQLRCDDVRGIVTAALDEERSKPPEQADAKLIEDLGYLLVDWG